MAKFIIKMRHLRFSTSLAVLMLAFVVQGGCQSRTASGSGESQTQSSPSDMKESSLPKSIKPLEDNSKPEVGENGRDEPLGVQKVTGTLVASKGNLPMIGTVVLDPEQVFEEDSRQWKAEYAALKNKRVTAVGEVIRHWCGPHEECLSKGYIDNMRPIQEFRKGSK